MEFHAGVAQTEIQVVVSDGNSASGEDQHQSEAYFSAFDQVGEDILPLATNPSSEDQNQSESSSNTKKAAGILFSGSLALMLAMPGGLNNRGNVVLGDTISFKIFFFTDSLAVFASFSVAMILTFDLQMPRMVLRRMEIIVGLAALCFLLALTAAGFAVMIPDVKWIVLCFVAGGAMLLSFLIYRAFFRSNQHNLPLAVHQMSQHHRRLNSV